MRRLTGDEVPTPDKASSLYLDLRVTSVDELEAAVQSIHGELEKRTQEDSLVVSDRLDHIEEELQESAKGKIAREQATVGDEECYAPV